MKLEDDLLRLLKIPCEPHAQGKEFVRIVCGVDFEPHGRASEAWEIIWKLELPQIPYYWKSTTGWQRGKTDNPMWFSGRTFENIVRQAVLFLEDIQQNTELNKERIEHGND